MKRVIRFICRLIFWPVGLIALACTAAIEIMADDTDWEYWRDHNALLLQMMWLRRG